METVTKRTHLVREVFRLEKILVDQMRQTVQATTGLPMTVICDGLATIEGGLTTLEQLVFGEFTEEQRKRLASYLGVSDG